MNGFQKTAVGSLLTGRELIQICVGQNEVIFHFEPTAAITVFSMDSFLLENKFGALKSGDGILSALGSSILEFIVIDDGHAAIHMSNGSKILITDDSKEYESVTIRHRGGTIVV